MEEAIASARDEAGRPKGGSEEKEPVVRLGLGERDWAEETSTYKDSKRRKERERERPRGTWSVVLRLASFNFRVLTIFADGIKCAGLFGRYMYDEASGCGLHVPELEWSLTDILQTTWRNRWP